MDRHPWGDVEKLRPGRIVCFTLILHLGYIGHSFFKQRKIGRTMAGRNAVKEKPNSNATAAKASGKATAPQRATDGPATDGPAVDPAIRVVTMQSWLEEAGGVLDDPTGDIEEIDDSCRPVFRWVPKQHLVIDPRYQRVDMSRRGAQLVFNIVQRFSWRLFQSLIAYPYDNIQYAAVDGGHRLRGAWLRPEIAEVPVMVYPTASLADQAKMFVDMNSKRVAMSPLQLHHASAMAGDPEASGIASACAAAGVTVAPTARTKGTMQPREVSGLQALRRIYRDYGPDVLTRVLKLLVDAYGDTPGIFRPDLMKALAPLVGGKVPGINLEVLVRVLKMKTAQQHDVSGITVSGIWTNLRAEHDRILRGGR